LKAWSVLAILLMQSLLLLIHWFIFHTLVAFSGNLGPARTQALRNTLFLLAFSFIVAALLSFNFSNWLVVGIYRVAAVWLGFLNFIFVAACASWLVWFALLLLPLSPILPHLRPLIATAFFALALLASIYGLLNARWIRIRRIPVTLPNLPPSWRGRTALLISDLHLGHVNGLGFSQRIARIAADLHPDVVFLPGDVFDGTKTDADRIVAPFRQLAPPFGIYFSTGNHEEYGGAAHYSAALTRAGIRVLSNEKVVADGLQILGVPYRDSTSPIRLRAILEGLQLDPVQASILLNHVPSRLPIVERAGVSLQLSGHTHSGQLFPSTWFARRIFGKFTDGLQRFGELQVFTSSGAGTWGPPMRVGSRSEMVLLHFE
jgi:predicted MPP superfamily phosphohydrolase